MQAQEAAIVKPARSVEHCCPAESPIYECGRTSFTGLYDSVPKVVEGDREGRRTESSTA